MSYNFNFKSRKNRDRLIYQIPKVSMTKIGSPATLSSLKESKNSIISAAVPKTHVDEEKHTNYAVKMKLYFSNVLCFFFQFNIFVPMYTNSI